MDTAPPLETVLQALHALYHGDSGGGKEKASLWLGELQKSVFAWQISDQLLQLNQDVESCYFAAQTMRTKIQYAFHELPPTSHQSLRDSLLNHCTNISAETPPVIVTQLCLALADLALQMSSWRNATEELIKRFGCDAKHWTFLIELLSLIPEEIGSRSLRLGGNRRNELTEELSSASGLLVQFLTAILDASADDERLCGQVLHCLGSWLAAYVIPEQHLVSSKLILLPFQALMNKDCNSTLHHMATECLCSSLMVFQNLANNSALAELLYDGVMSLADMFRLAVTSDDMDKSMNYCRLFTELGETFIEPLVSSSSQFGDLRIVELLLECVSQNHYEVADVTFLFWNSLSQTLYEHNEQKTTELFKPFVERLIVALFQLCQYDVCMETLPDDTDDFDDFRMQASELICDIHFVVGSTSLYHEMYKRLKGDGTGASWEIAEASLFVMTSVARHIPQDESSVVPQVLDVILNLSGNAHIAVRRTTMKLIPALREWINNHPQFLASILQHLLSGLQLPKLATVAGAAVQVICSTCSEKMTSLFPQLLQVTKSIDSFNLSNEAAIDLLKGTAFVLGKMPSDSLTDSLQQLCFLQVDQLTRILEHDGVQYVTGKKDDPTVWLDRLAAIFRYTTPSVENGKKHPCQDIVLQVWPVISRTFSKYSSDVSIIERCCCCIRFAVRCLGASSTEILVPLVAQIVDLYKVYKHSCCLYLGSILVDEYGGHDECTELLLDMFQKFCGPTFVVLEEQFGLRNHPDIVDDLFRLCFRFILRAPLSFLRSVVFLPVLNCAILCCSLDHKDANESVSKFLIEFIKGARKPEENGISLPLCELVTSYLEKVGQDLVNGIMKSCLFCLPTFMLNSPAEILCELMLVDRPSACKWLEVTLKALPTHTAGGAITATPKQLYDFHKTITSAEDLKQVHKTMRDFTRLFH